MVEFVTEQNPTKTNKIFAKLSFGIEFSFIYFSVRYANSK